MCDMYLMCLPAPQRCEISYFDHELSILREGDVWVYCLGTSNSDRDWKYAEFGPRGWKSYIDHCFISGDHCHLATSCNVLHDDIHNVSDHLALSVKLKVILPIAIALAVRVQVAWHKVTSCEIEELYTKPLDGKCGSLIEQYGIDPIVIMTGETAYENHLSINVETFLGKFVDQIRAVSGNLKHSKFSKHLKPWVKARRPRNNGDPMLIRYK